MNEADALLKYAVEEIVLNINKKGMDAQGAVTKVAKELDLNPHFIKRASEAINVALHWNHLKKAEDKAADFPLVDAAKVAEDIFGTQEKTASEFNSTFFSPVDSTDSLPNFNKYQNDPRFKRAFEEILNSKGPEGNYALAFKTAFDKSAQYVKQLEQDLNTAKTKLADAEFNVNRKFASLANHFSKDAGHRTTFGEFESQVYSLHGKRALPYVDFIHKSASIKEDRGTHDDKYKLFDTCKEAQMFGDFLTAVDTFNKVQEHTKVAEENLAFESDYRDTVVKAAYDNLDKEAGISGKAILSRIKEEQTGKDPVMERYNQKKAEADKIRLEQIKEAFSVAGPFEALLNRYKEEATPGSSVPSTSKEDNLDRKLLVEELAVTDPILSTVQPKRLVDAYQQFLHYGPELSKEKETVRAALRSMTQGQAMSPFDAQQIIEANTKYTQQKLMQEGKFKQPGK
jgi:hypothetical protein